MVKKFSNLEVRFTTFRRTLTACHPCGLLGTVNVIGGESAEWAFLQTYEEVDARGNVQGLMLDNDESNGQKVPFYSASHLSPCFCFAFAFIPHGPDGFAGTHYRVLRSLQS